MQRRNLVAALCGAPLLAGAQTAQAEFPSRPVRLVVPYAPGGIADLLGRLVAEKLGPLWKQPVVVDNRPGAGGHVGGELVARSAPAKWCTLPLPEDE